MKSTVDVQKNIADYVEWMGISNVKISEKTGIPEQKVGRQLAQKQKMTANEFYLYCDALEKEPNYFCGFKRQEERNDSSEIPKAACGVAAESLGD